MIGTIRRRIAADPRRSSHAVAGGSRTNGKLSARPSGLVPTNASVYRTDQLSDGLKLAGRGSGRSRTMPIPSKGFRSRCNRPSNPSADAECSAAIQLIETNKVGSPGRIRTYSLSVNSRMLWFHTLEALRKLWRGGRGSNPD